MLRLLFVAVLLVGMAHVSFSMFVAKIESDARFTQEQTIADRIEIRWQNLECFQGVIKQTVAELSEGETTLADAIERIEFFARGHIPVYLRQLRDSEKSRTLKEQIARNIVAHFVAAIAEDDDQDGQLNKVLCRLKVEMAAMFRLI